MTTPRPWLRLAGTLAEDLTFTPHVGWETHVVARLPDTGDGTFVVEALDAQGNVVVDVAPAVRFEGGTRTGVREAHLEAYLPFVPTVRRVRLRRGGYVVWRRDVAEHPPRVGEVRAEVTAARTLHIAWRSEPGPGSSPELAHRIVWIAEGRGVFPLSGDVRGQEHEIALSRVPGSPMGRVAVLASDGLRSAVATSEPLPLPMRPARVVIHAPRPGEVVPHGQPVTLRGAAFDDAGQRLDAAGLTWTLDSQAHTSDERAVELPPLRPGEHHVVLVWEGAGAPRAEARTRFVVSPPPASDLEPLEPLEAMVEGDPGGPLRIKL